MRAAGGVQAIGMAPAISRRAMEWPDRFNAAYAAALQLGHRQAAFSRFVRYVQQSLILAVGTLLVIDSQISPASMIAANILMNRALSPIDTIIATWRSFVSARQARTRLRDFLQTHEPVAAHPQANSGAAPAAGVKVSHLIANAPGRQEPILKDLSFEVPPASITLVMGPSGSGKSTLMRAITGAWPDLEGEVRVGGRPIGDLTDEQRAQGLGSMPQDNELFEGSIAENISRFAQPSPSGSPSAQDIAQAVIAAARAAGLHEAILRLPAGYDTPVGVGGGALSGGQRQRIALARALFGNPPVLVLDEPNANLDDVGEAALIRALQERRAQGATILIVSHNPQMVNLADRVLVLADGRLLSHDVRPASNVRPSMPQP